ncbi:MAG: ATP-binding cassette domain-containing protein, partial [Lachnospiraceae bacterium]|nr:ATP-binding cassette domain-containing protein [Lachnospiraceae bacterium]
MELIIENLSKSYKDKKVVENISLILKPGVYGLLGANGAGKTTLMRMLCGILKADTGSVTFDGIAASSEEYRDVLGYLPQDFGYYPEFTGMEFLMYMASLKGLNKTSAKKKATELMDLVGLGDKGRKKIKTYSGGMKQRLGIAQALLNDPKVIILDEPTVGLDPKQIIEIRSLIRSLGKKHTVIFSSHVLTEVSAICDRIIVISNGKIVADE